MKKVLLISSSGGHLTQLKLIKDHISVQKNEYKLKIASEKISKNDSIDYKFRQFNRKKINMLFALVYNLFLSIKIYFEFKPDIIISTGAGVVVLPVIVFKLLGSKIIYVESFAKRLSLTKSGSLIYKVADAFYVQWPELLEKYPKAKFKGGLY